MAAFPPDDRPEYYQVFDPKDGSLPAPPPKLVVMREANLLDVPATLRRWAEAIEAGEYGDVSGCVVVVDGTALEVGYMGRGEAGPRAVLLLATAQAKIVNGVLEIQAE